MRLATYNIESLDLGAEGDAPFETRAAVLRPILQRLDADILCLQEVNGQRIPGESGRRLLALERLLDGTRYAAFARAATAGASGRGVAGLHNLVTLSRYPIRHHRDVRHDYVKPPLHSFATGTSRGAGPQPVAFDRPLLLAEIELPGGRSLAVVNLHLRAPRASPVAGEKLDSVTWRSMGGWAEGYFLSTVKRTAQALELRLLVDEMLGRDPERLVAAAGDFNAEDGDTPLLLAAGPDVRAAGGDPLPQALLVLDRALPVGRRWSVLNRGRRLMPDHILASPALWRRLSGIEVHNEEQIDVGLLSTGTAVLLASEHAPVVAEFALG